MTTDTHEPAGQPNERDPLALWANESTYTTLGEITGPVKLEDNMGGGSDDIGDISWNLPTVTLRYPANIPGLPGHNWSSAIASATPIAHKGVVAGAKVQAMTVLDLLKRHGWPALHATAGVVDSVAYLSLLAFWVWAAWRHDPSPSLAGSPS